MDQHESVKSWWPEVTHISVQHYPNRASVESAEKSAIKSEKPQHNLVHAEDWELYTQHIKNISTGAVMKSKKFGNGKHEWIYTFMQMTSSIHSLDIQNRKDVEIRYLQAWWVMTSYQLAKVQGFYCRACESMLETPAAVAMQKHGAALVKKTNN